MKKLVIFGIGSIADEIANFAERYALYEVVGYILVLSIVLRKFFQTS